MTDVPARERVHEAVTAAVRAASELVEESDAADVETRIRMVVDGWGRALAAGLEELAVTLEELQRREAPSPEPHDVPTPKPPGDARESSEPPSPPSGSEEELHAEAAASRAETQALREEAQADAEERD